MWSPFHDGNTIGTQGSEEGVILADEENDEGARITLERDGYVPYAITCGVYGLMVHTVFAADEDEAKRQYEAMKTEIDRLMSDDDIDPVQWCHDFVDRFQ